MGFYIVKKKMQKTLGLLAIDGGGSRGIIAARILQHLETVTGKPLWKCFDFGAGSSTGGFLILSTLMRRTPASQLVPMYQDLCSEIFSWRPTRVREYDVKPLERELKQHYGEIRMTRYDEKDPSVFVVTRRNNEPEPYLLRNYDVVDNENAFNGASGWPCWEAARATSAAHTYFPPFVRDNAHYTDAAIGFDNPVLLLYMETLQQISQQCTITNSEELIPDIGYIVSIGTGKMDDWEPPTGKPKAGIRRVFETLLFAVEIVVNLENAHYDMKRLAKANGDIPYFRFNPITPGRHQIDIRKKKKLNELVALTEDYLRDDDIGVPKQIEKLKTLINTRFYKYLY